MQLFTQPTVYIDYLKQSFDPVDCTSSIHRLNEHVGTLKYADYWHNRLRDLQVRSRYGSHWGMICLSKAFSKQTQAKHAAKLYG